MLKMGLWVFFSLTFNARAVDIRYVDLGSQAQVDYEEYQTESVQGLFPEDIFGAALQKNKDHLKTACSSLRGVLSRTICVMEESIREKQIALPDGSKVSGTLSQWVRAYCRVDRDQSVLQQILLYRHLEPVQAKNFEGCIRRELR